MRDTSPSAIHLDARHSPALAIPPELLHVGRHDRARLARREDRFQPELYDGTLRWLAATDRIVSDEAARALLEVKEGRLHVREGHARWSTYLRAFVPMTARWCQQEIRRVRALRDYPLLAAAWAAGVLGKSHLRVVLRAVMPATEEAWLNRATGCTVRELEELAARAPDADEGVVGATGGTAGAHDLGGGADADLQNQADGAGAAEQNDAGGTGAAEQDDPEEARSTRRVVMAPPGVAALVSEAVEVARKMAAYQIGIGAAVEMMAMEMMAGLNECSISSDSPSNTTESSAANHSLPDETSVATPSEPHSGGQATPPGELRETDVTTGRCEPSRYSTADPHETDRSAGRCDPPRRRRVSLGDHLDLRREMGVGWERIHQQMEAATGRWRDLPSDLREVLIHGAPAQDAGAHERVVFWTGLQGRLDAVRGRLLRIVQEEYVPHSLGFAGFGQYVRERMGLSLRDAYELVRLDKALERLPAAFHMYASGRLGRRAAWLLSRVARTRTDRAWTHFAMTHTLRLLEIVVEGALLKREADPQGWERDGGLPPQDTTFAGATRACSLLSGVRPGAEATARVEFLLDPEQLACYEATLERLRDVGGRDCPEWWGLAVMARYFLDCYGEEDRLASSARLRRMFHRRIIERDNYTCRAPECMQRGGLEADHMDLRSQGGSTTHENMGALCAADHRFIKHTAGTLTLSGMAPDNVTARMGSRVYFNDNLIEPALDEALLDEDPWRSSAVDRWEPGSSGITAGLDPKIPLNPGALNSENATTQPRR